MREMVFNHASARCLDVGRGQLVDWRREIAIGMATLVSERIVCSALHMEKTFSEVECLPEFTLYGAIQSLRRNGYRDEYVFLLRLVTKNPLINGLDARLLDRFLGCQDRTLDGLDGAPLVLAAIADWVVISIPSKTYWDDDLLSIQFDEILSDERVEETTEEVDQLSRVRHADAIGERNLDRTRAGADPKGIWANRETVFPNLLFAPGVESDLLNCANVVQTVVGKLSALNRSAEMWVHSGGPAPTWGTKVSPESVDDMRNIKFRGSRTFRSVSGSHEVFEWHARYGASGRIHLRFDRDAFEVEIGYIGSHLPTEV